MRRPMSLMLIIVESPKNARSSSYCEGFKRVVPLETCIACALSNLRLVCAALRSWRKCLRAIMRVYRHKGNNCHSACRVKRLNHRHRLCWSLKLRCQLPATYLQVLFFPSLQEASIYSKKRTCFDVSNWTRNSNFSSICNWISKNSLSLFTV